jgi:hypothetical protein
LAAAIANPATPEICRIKMKKLEENSERELAEAKCDELLRAQDNFNAIE